jgi:hypothetical protein
MAKLAADRQITKAGKTGEWRLHLNLRRELDARYGGMVTLPPAAPKKLMIHPRSMRRSLFIGETSRRSCP